MFIQTFGKKKNSIAVTTCKPGKGLIKINGISVNSVTPTIVRDKLLEPIFLLNPKYRIPIDLSSFVKGGGLVSRIYAVRQSFAKSLVLYFSKYISVRQKNIIKRLFLNFDKKLLISSPRYQESKKFGGKGARARFQKSYR